MVTAGATGSHLNFQIPSPYSNQGDRFCPYITEVTPKIPRGLHLCPMFVGSVHNFGWSDRLDIVKNIFMTSLPKKSWNWLTNRHTGSKGKRNREGGRKQEHLLWLSSRRTLWSPKQSVLHSCAKLKILWILFLFVCIGRVYKSARKITFQVILPVRWLHKKSTHRWKHLHCIENTLYLE